jgi:rhodanese-related sulfurtransferase
MKESWTLSVEEALHRLRHEKVQLLDVRSRQEFEQTHMPGAFCIPLDELAERLSELNPSEKMLIYCHRGIRSAHAVSLLREHGFLHAYHIEGGLTQITHFLSENPESS